MHEEVDAAIVGERYEGGEAAGRGQHELRSDDIFANPTNLRGAESHVHLIRVPLFHFEDVKGALALMLRALVARLFVARSSTVNSLSSAKVGASKAPG
ncbi:hypothetical protein FH063_004080 [Azospirillum argentinense]|uniref:Uncharacterized protein n=1 Tax=Azospirillum argentinense TaxID=2970906 RepID=A0A5B0KJ46_9PROT|nr:hypothetical protein FH063_004080 [Azospirillum argentinense]